MKHQHKYISLAFVGTLACFQSLPSASAATVTWGNDNSFSGIGLLSTALLPAGDLVRIGAFNITPAQISANATNLSYLDSHFVQFSSTTIGSGNPFGDGSTPAGYWNAPNALNLTTTLGIAGSQIYYWAFNAPTLSAATQTGVFTDPGTTAWIFPADTAVPNSTTTDLGDVPNSAAGVLIGEYETVGASGLPQYNLAPVPEPSSYALCGIFAAVITMFRPRRKLT